jgi:hypothetical protein
MSAIINPTATTAAAATAIATATDAHGQARIDWITAAAVACVTYTTIPIPTTIIIAMVTVTAVAVDNGTRHSAAASSRSAGKFEGREEELRGFVEGVQLSTFSATNMLCTQQYPRRYKKKRESYQESWNLKP